MKYIFFVLSFLPHILLGQTATFYADTSRFYKEMIHNKALYNKIMESEWLINGQKLRYGSAAVSIKTDHKIDTILYRNSEKSGFDTLICNIKWAKNYVFVYNECCGGFNVLDRKNRIINGSASFVVRNKDPQKKQIGTLDDAGILLKNNRSCTLKTICRSALLPNIYLLTVKEIEICTDSLNCPEGICLFNKKKNVPIYDFGYRTISEKISFLYLPTRNRPVKIIYNNNSGKIKIR